MASGIWERLNKEKRELPFRALIVDMNAQQRVQLAKSFSLNSVSGELPDAFAKRMFVKCTKLQASTVEKNIISAMEKFNSSLQASNFSLWSAKSVEPASIKAPVQNDIKAQALAQAVAQSQAVVQAPAQAQVLPQAQAVAIAQVLAQSQAVAFAQVQDLSLARTQVLALSQTHALTVKENWKDLIFFLKFNNASLIKNPFVAIDNRVQDGFVIECLGYNKDHVFVDRPELDDLAELLMAAFRSNSEAFTNVCSKWCDIECKLPPVELNEDSSSTIFNTLPTLRSSTFSSSSSSPLVDFSIINKKNLDAAFFKCFKR
jgi:hypothetical protein